MRKTLMVCVLICAPTFAHAQVIANASVPTQFSAEAVARSRSLANRLEAEKLRICPKQVGAEVARCMLDYDILARDMRLAAFMTEEVIKAERAGDMLRRKQILTELVPLAFKSSDQAGAMKKKYIR